MNELEVLKTLQNTLSLLVKKEEESNIKEKSYKEVNSYKRDKTVLITCKEAAKEYKIGEAKFRELCRSKNKGFPVIHIGSRHFIVKNKLDQWLQSNAIGDNF